MQCGRLVVPVKRIVVRLPGVELVVVHGGRLQVLILLRITSTVIIHQVHPTPSQRARQHQRALFLRRTSLLTEHQAVDKVQHIWLPVVAALFNTHGSPTDVVNTRWNAPSVRQNCISRVYTYPSGKVEPDGAPGELVVEVGAGVVLAVVYEALLLALHVRARVLQAKLQHLLGVLQQLIRILRLCKIRVSSASLLQDQAVLN